MATAPVSVIQSQAVSEICPSSDNWTLWNERLDIYFTEINCEEDNTKKAILLKLIGSEAYGVLHSLCSPESPISKAFKVLCQLLATHYTPPTIVFQQRRIFHTASKRDDETMAGWFARVKNWR